MARKRFDWLLKLVALLLVISSLTIGIIGLGVLVELGHWWGILLILFVPFGIWTGLKITPEGGTTGYFDQNI